MTAEHAGAGRGRRERRDPVVGRIARRGARGARPRGPRAPARRVLGRRVRYHIGCEPGQVNGRRWPAAAGPVARPPKGARRRAAWVR